MYGFGSIKIARCGSNLTFYFAGPDEPFSFMRVNYVPFCICQLAEMSDQPIVMLTSLFGYIVVGSNSRGILVLYKYTVICLSREYYIIIRAVASTSKLLLSIPNYKSLRYIAKYM
jgi:hypothetical protein